VRGVAFSPDGNTLASGSEDGTVILWDVETSTPALRLTNHRDDVWSVAFSPDGQTLASASLDRSVILWNIPAQPALGQPYVAHSADVYSLRFVDQTMLSGGGDAILRWTDDRPALAMPTGDLNAVTIALSPDGQKAASGGLDGAVRLWDITSGESIGQPLMGHNNAVIAVTLSDDGQLLASGDDNGVILLWDLSGWAEAQGERAKHASPLQILAGHTDGIQALAFSLDGKTLASGSKDNMVIVWDVQTGKPIFEPLAGHTSRVLSLAFSPDGKTLASGSRDTFIMLWDVATGEPIHQLVGQGDEVMSLAFKPDGKTLASGGRNNTVLLWDIASGRPIGQPFAGHSDWVISMAFNTAGDRLASGDRGGGIIVWDTSIDSWRLRACDIANRSLTTAEWAQFFGSELYRETCPL
jgi:WD40 repeat protein